MTEEQLAAIEARADCADVDALVAEVRRLQAENAELRREIGQCGAHRGYNDRGEPL